jgi:hypothetical protein
MDRGSLFVSAHLLCPVSMLLQILWTNVHCIGRRRCLKRLLRPGKQDYPYRYRILGMEDKGNHSTVVFWCLLAMNCMGGCEAFLCLQQQSRTVLFRMLITRPCYVQPPLSLSNGGVVMLHCHRCVRSVASLTVTFISKCRWVMMNKQNASSRDSNDFRITFCVILM